MLNILGTPTKIQVTGEKLDDVIDNRQQAQAVAAANASQPDGWNDKVEKKDNEQA